MALLASLPLILFACSVVQQGIHHAGYSNLPDLRQYLFYWLLKLAVPGLMLIALSQLIVAIYVRKLKRRHFIERTAMCFLVYGGAVACGWLVYSQPSNLELFVRGFRDRLTEDVDLAALRHWHNQLTRAPPSDSTLSTSDLPADILRLRPNHVFRHGDAVHICWGSGFGGWGVTIMPIDALPEDSAYYAVHLQAAPGIYVWHNRG